MRWTLKPLDTTVSNEPELPRVYVDTTLYAPTGDTHHVAAGGNLQTAINAAALGDVITLEAGATFTGPFTLPDKGAGTDYIIIRTDTTDQNFVAEGTRVAPADASLMPHLVSTTSSVFETADAAHHYRLIGLEISPLTSSFLHGLVWMGDGSETLTNLPHHIIIDRCYIHGNATYACNKGVLLNGGTAAVIDSYISEIKNIATESADTNAIGGWAGSGPFKVVNNYLEAAGENVLLGGADPSINGMIASDIEFKRNYCYKPIAWRGVWGVKNLFELKNVQRVLVEGNLFEQTWHDTQTVGILFSPRNSSGNAPWSIVQDVTFRSNVVRSAPFGMYLLGKDNEQTSQRMARLAIRNNLFVDINGTTWGAGEGGQMFGMGYGSNGVIFEHNTTADQNKHFLYLLLFDQPTTILVFKNNITAFGYENEAYGISGEVDNPPYQGTVALEQYATVYSCVGNVFSGQPTKEGIYPSGNFWPSTYADVEFEDLDNGDYRLAATSDYRNAATDGTDIGIDKAALDAAMGDLARTYW